MTTRPRSPRVARIALVGLVLTMLLGCPQGNLPSVLPVKGTVTHQGKPLAGATVMFVSKAGKLAAGEIAFGTTDAQGHFQLMTQVSGKITLHGAIAGEHRVTISKFVPPPGMTEEAYQQKFEAEKRSMETQGYVPPGEAAPPKVELLPAQYSSAPATTLSAIVKKGDKNDFTFELK